LSGSIIPQFDLFQLVAHFEHWSLRTKTISEYLEVLAIQFDTPPLDEFRFSLFHQPKLEFYPFYPCLEASIFCFSSCSMSPHLWHIKCNRFDWQVASVAQICSQILPSLSSMESLIIKLYRLPPPSNDMDSIPWLQIFHSFPSIWSLSIHVKKEPFYCCCITRAHRRISHRSIPLATKTSYYWV
jgi:hypothetical protein